MSLPRHDISRETHHFAHVAPLIYLRLAPPPSEPMCFRHCCKVVGLISQTGAGTGATGEKTMEKWKRCFCDSALYHEEWAQVQVVLPPATFTSQDQCHMKPQLAAAYDQFPYPSSSAIVETRGPEGISAKLLSRRGT